MRPPDPQPLFQFGIGEVRERVFSQMKLAHRQILQNTAGLCC